MTTNQIIDKYNIPLTDEQLREYRRDLVKRLAKLGEKAEKITEESDLKEPYYEIGKWVERMPGYPDLFEKDDWEADGQNYPMWEVAEHFEANVIAYEDQIPELKPIREELDLMPYGDL